MGKEKDSTSGAKRYIHRHMGNDEGFGHFGPCAWIFWVSISARSGTLWLLVRGHFLDLLQLPRVLGGLVIVNIHEVRMEVVVLSGRAWLKVLH